MYQRTACLVNMESSVNNDPSYKEASSTGEKSFLGQFPSPTILSFIDTLISERQLKPPFSRMQGYLNCCNPNIDNASGDASKEDKAEEAL